MLLPTDHMLSVYIFASSMRCTIPWLQMEAERFGSCAKSAVVQILCRLFCGEQLETCNVNTVIISLHTTYEAYLVPNYAIHSYCFPSWCMHYFLIANEGVQNKLQPPQCCLLWTKITYHMMTMTAAIRHTSCVQRFYPDKPHLQDLFQATWTSHDNFPRR